MSSPFLRTRLATVTIWTVATVCAAITTAVFWPGYLSFDSTQQLAQALGRQPFSDWHPVALALLWRGLIEVTGTPATMVVVQVVLYWSLLAALGVLVGQRWKRPWAGIAVLVVGAMPQSIGIVGVVWKDIHLALALGLAVVVAARAAGRERQRVAWGSLSAGVVLLVYAGLVRKNALAAVIPVAVFLSWATLRRPTWRAVGATVLALPGLIIGTQAILDAAIEPVRTHITAGVMLDDVVALARPSDFRVAGTDGWLVARVQHAQLECERAGIHNNVYADCYRARGEPPFGPVADADRISRLWEVVVKRHFGAYLTQRAKVFSTVLFATRNPVQRPPVFPNDEGITVGNPHLAQGLERYVIGVQIRAPWLFGGFLWLAVGTAMVVVGWLKRWMPVACVGASVSFYLLAYFLIAPAADYRYVYWPALAGSVTLVLVAIRGVLLALETRGRTGH